MKMFADNRTKLLHSFEAEKSHISGSGAEVVLLQGGEATFRHDTDHEQLFRQESYFQYLFGVKEPNFYGAIDITNKKSILFIERLPQEYAVWMGEIYPTTHFKNLYEVDEVKYSDEIADYLKNELKTKVIYTMKGLNSDSGSYFKEATFKGIDNFRVDNGRLFPLLRECRVIKSEDELNVLRYVNKVSSRAHMEVMRKVKPGILEYQIEAFFQYEVYHNGGCRHCSYTCICASGNNSATLHYGHAAAPNNRQIKDGELVLLDMGAEYNCYASDITRTYPVNGKFTEDQKEVYESVLAAQDAVLNAMKPGILWPDMHRLANKVICEELKKHGFIKGEVDDLVKNHIGSLFMPHGLGHFLGLDTHDVGGYPEGVERSKEPGLKSLRSGRALKEGMVITVEPGIYFISAILEPALQDPEKSKFLVAEKIQRFKNFGGVRLEDNVIVTKNGIENMTQIPIKVKEIEEWIANGK